MINSNGLYLLIRLSKEDNFNKYFDFERSYNIYNSISDACLYGIDKIHSLLEDLVLGSKHKKYKNLGGQKMKLLSEGNSIKK